MYTLLLLKKTHTHKSRVFYSNIYNDDNNILYNIICDINLDRCMSSGKIKRM